MSQFYVVAGFNHLGEVELNCRNLQKNGLFPLIIVNENCEADYQNCADNLVFCRDIFSGVSVAESLLPYKDKIARFINVHDKLWTSILDAAIRLNIPVPNLQGQINSRLKARMRDILAEILPLKYEILSIEDCARENVEEIINRLGVPFVAKPIWGQGSDYVEIIKDKAQAFDIIQEIFHELQQDTGFQSFYDGEKNWSANRQILLEEFITGNEYSFEGFIQQGELVPLMIQEKYFWGNRGNIHFETGNLSPTPFLKPSEKQQIYGILHKILGKLEINDTFVHIEFKWDGKRLNVIEVNPRMGGGSVPKMLNFWYGRDFSELALKLQIGETLPTGYEGRDGFLLGAFINAPQTGIFDSFEGLEWVHSRPEFCFDMKYFNTWQYIPPPGKSKADRNAWMYCYDAFFLCRNVEQIDYFYNQTRERVKLKFKTKDEIEEFLSAETEDE